MAQEIDEGAKEGNSEEDTEGAEVWDRPQEDKANDESDEQEKGPGVYIHEAEISEGGVRHWRSWCGPRGAAERAKVIFHVNQRRNLSSHHNLKGAKSRPEERRGEG